MSALYPNYRQMRSRLSPRIWHALGAAMVVGALALVAALLLAPRLGLIVWWLYVVPALPMLWMLAPGIWRNVCPMAMLNQLPGAVGLSLGRSTPGWLRRKAFAIQGLVYFALITTRVPVLDRNGPAVAALILVALAAAFAGGVVFKGKSGWCGTFCPLQPIQRLYGQTPAVAVPTSHCRPCVGCMTNCYDAVPHVAYHRDVEHSEPGHALQRKVFAGVLPGFVLAFFTVPNSLIAGPPDIGVTVADYYLQTAAYMLASLAIFFLLDALLPLSPAVLAAAFGAAALNFHNVLRFPTSFNWDKPAWVLGVEYTAVALVTLTFVVRTYVKERRLAGGLDVPLTMAWLTTRGHPNGRRPMEEARTTRRAPILVALTGVILLAAIWATMALAGGSTPAAKPAAKAPAAKAHVSNGITGFAGKSGGRDCPNEEQATSNDL